MTDEAKSVIDADYHRLLIKDLPRFAQTANIPQSMVYEPLSSYCGEDEIQWVANLKNHVDKGRFGMVYFGSGYNPRVDLRMMAIAGACLRNFLDARVLPLHVLLDKEETPDPTLLLIPSFCTTETTTLASWKRLEVADIILQRQFAGKMTVVQVDDVSALAKVYGVAVQDLIVNSYQQISK